EMSDPRRLVKSRGFSCFGKVAEEGMQDNPLAAFPLQKYSEMHVPAKVSRSEHSCVPRVLPDSVRNSAPSGESRIGRGEGTFLLRRRPVGVDYNQFSDGADPLGDYQACRAITRGHRGSPGFFLSPSERIAAVGADDGGGEAGVREILRGSFYPGRSNAPVRHGRGGDERGSRK